MMERLTLALVGVGLTALTMGCSSASAVNDGSQAAQDGGLLFDGSIILPDGAPSVLTQREAAELFAAEHVAQIDFSVPDGQWGWLQANAKQEKYVGGRASYDGQPAGLIGLRFKGNYGTLVRCFDAAGKLTCPKLSFKVDFAEYDAQNRFFGLKKVNLHSMINDPTKLHEKLAYDLYRSSGVPAPRSTWANVRVNGTNYGLFSLVEEIDGRFTEDRWPGNGDGNLYKEAWPGSASPSFYVTKLETNKTTASNDEIATFAGELLAAPAGQRSSTLAKWADIPTLQRYMAVDDAIFNCDGVTAWYSGGPGAAGAGNHNYHLYQERARSFFWLIPWDLDATLSICAPFAPVPPWFTAPDDCNKNYSVWGGASVKAPGCERLFQALAEDRPGYQAAVDQLLAGPFAVERMAATIDQWAVFIRASAAADPDLGGEAGWMGAVSQLKKSIPLLRERLMVLRDGKSLVPTSLALTGINAFEQETALGVTLGLTAVANPGTDIAVTLNTTDALGGARDVRADFVYRDSGDAPSQAYGQWIYLFFPLAGGYQDLTVVKEIHMRLRSDHQRVVRIDLESDKYVAGNAGIKFGWEVPVADTPTDVVLVVDKATLPSWASIRTDTLTTVRPHISGVAFNPATIARNSSGYLGPGVIDPGFLEVDDVLFVRSD
jgi:hypothetical protein